ncbi:undecaprenyldiphospho-muramoylpentapeptide beta-N-acetylglucosaminyltransferase [Bifidobacterium aquikefiri]|uniref:undecaprenyldiphospho-muramoylpentapeptide beta-N-acetylglucosaminyltransferase n=1 Tax=Bifidobacterium aquikefiri TaxID=1653207 RepID=UPI0039E9C640
MGTEEEKIRVVLAGGGTAGHVNPLLSVARALRTRNPHNQISVIGTQVGLERDLVPQAGFALDTIEKVPFPRSLNLALFTFPFRWMREVHKVKRILRDHQAQVVVGFGGYASAPVYRAAHLMHIPILIHEQNAKAGMANKLGARWADFIGTVYENTGLEARKGARIERIGLPLRPTISELANRIADNAKLARVEASSALGIDTSRPLVLVTGGSLGAVSLNQSVARSAGELLNYVQIIHLTGKGKGDEVRSIVEQQVGANAVNSLGIGKTGQGDYHVVEYLERIDLAFACADLVICRSGAGTVAELTALGIPAVYVPLPIGNGEQRYNAQPVVDAHGGIMVDDDEFTPTWIREHVIPLLRNRENLLAMGKSAWNYGTRDAAETMAARVESCA